MVDYIREERTYLRDALLSKDKKYDGIKMELEIAWNKYLEQKYEIENEFKSETTRLWQAFEVLENS